jgi:hypothetical protein
MKDFKCVRKRVGEQSMLISAGTWGRRTGQGIKLKAQPVAQLGGIGGARGNEVWALHEELKDG